MATNKKKTEVDVDVVAADRKALLDELAALKAENAGLRRALAKANLRARGK